MTDYAFSITDESGLEVSGGCGTELPQLLKMAFHYYAQYLQEGPHTLRMGPAAECKEEMERERTE